jgi:signal transduction histidine kinase
VLMQVFRPDDQPDRPHGIMLLRDRALNSARRSDADCRPPLRTRIWPLVSLSLVLISGLIGTPTPALHGEGLVTLLGGGMIAVLIAVEVLIDPQDDRAVFAYVLLLGLASTALMTVQPAGTAVLGTYAAVASAVIRLPKRLAIAAIVPIIAIVDILILIGGEERLLVLAWTSIAYAFMFVIGHLLRLSEERQIQARELLEEEERTRLARNEAAALDERSRIARELHDVLAHSLSALSVELEGARLLALDRDADSEVIAAIGRAHRHAAAGLDEARAAIKALRGDSVPGPDKIEDLIEEMRAHGIECTLAIGGEPRRLPSEAALAVFRTAQEALTNVRKHAEEAELVEIRLDYDPDGVQLIVTDSAGDGAEPRVPQPAALAAAGSGYGVSGMRERAELIGGRLLAGPTEDGFRVELWVPA